MSKKKTIHPVIKKTLGFDETLPDKDFLKQWKKKSTHVCKPCWELKYCPYGPFVEQSPILPGLRDSAIEHNEYLKKCLETNTMGGSRKLTPEQLEKKKKELEIFEKYPRFMLPDIFEDKANEELIQEGIDKNLELHDLYQTPYKDFETYQVPFPFDEDRQKKIDSVFAEIQKVKLTPDLKKRMQNKLKKLKQTVKTGIEDHSKPLDPIRRKYFEKCVSEFNPDNIPDYIPESVSELSCNIFGHICPVVFVGEAISETSEKRRKGRYISFKAKIRVVRRDNYTCQECKRHLKDDEVEFDHIIPVSKGGSSEEHNLRLTCYDCNRDKLDKVQI